MKKYINAKRRFDELTERSAMLKGQLKQIETTLKRDYDCDSIEEAEKELEKREKRNQEKQEQYEKELETIEDLLDDFETE